MALIDSTLNFTASRNDVDEARIHHCTVEQKAIKREFHEKADEHGIDLEPAPRIHTVHQQIADRSKFVSAVAHLGGGLIACGWSFLAAGNSLIVAMAAGLIYLLLAGALDLPATCFPKLIIRCFQKFYLPPLILCVAASCILLAERFASPELAKVLLTLDPYAWVGLEMSMLLLGALLSAAWTIFGWSGRLTSRYQALDHEITALKQAIDKRLRSGSLPENARSSSGGAAAIFAIALLFGIPASAVQCPSVLIDRTGSIHNQRALESQLTALIAAQLSGGGCVMVVPFTDNILGAPKNIIRIDTPKGAVFESMRAAGEEETRSGAEYRLNQVLRVALPKSGCTSLPDMLMRAAGESDRTLLLTDAQHTCGALPRRAPNDAAAPIIVLVRSETDTGNQSDVFMRRRDAILRWLPKARILPEFDLDRAVQSLFQTGGSDPTAATPRSILPRSAQR